MSAWISLPGYLCLFLCLGTAFPLVSGLIVGDVALGTWTSDLRALLPIHHLSPAGLKQAIVVGEGCSPTPTRKAFISGEE